MPPYYQLFPRLRCAVLALPLLPLHHVPYALSGRDHHDHHSSWDLVATAMSLMEQ
jgi:hypothetical protein